MSDFSKPSYVLNRSTNMYRSINATSRTIVLGIALMALAMPSMKVLAGDLIVVDGDLLRKPSNATGAAVSGVGANNATSLPVTQPAAAQNLAAQQPLSTQVLEAPSPPLFSIESGQRLSVALQSWLAPQGVSMVWDVSAGGERLRDIEMISEWRASSPDIEKTLAQLLPAFGLRAIVQDNPRAVIVRSASGSAVKTTGAAK